MINEESTTVPKGSKLICDLKHIIDKQVIQKQVSLISNLFFTHDQILKELRFRIHDNDEEEINAVRDLATEYFLITFKDMSIDVETINVNRFSLPLLLSWLMSLNITFDWHLIFNSIIKLIQQNDVTITLDLLWCLKDHGFMSIDSYFLSLNPTVMEQKIEEHTAELLQLFKPGQVNQPYTVKVRNKILLWLVSSAFSKNELKTPMTFPDVMKNKPWTNLTLPSTSNENHDYIYQRMIKKLILHYDSYNEIGNSDESNKNITSEIVTIIIASSLPNESIKSCFRFVIKTVMLQKSLTSRMDILEHQTCSKIKILEDKLQLNLVKDLLIPFSNEEVLELLQYAVNGICKTSKSEGTDLNVNWKFLMRVIDVFINYFENSSSLLKSLVEKLVVSSLDEEKQGQDSFETAMAIVRQACLASKNGPLQTYGLWFAHAFGDEETTLTANTKTKIKNLVKYLTSMVPYENVACLRAHLARPPYITSNYRDIWNDYCVLARTRLSDFNANKKLDWYCSDQPIFNSFKPCFNTFDKAESTSSETDLESNQNPVLSDVEKALNSFETTKKMPQIVLEASIFRRPYFVGQFLPALLELLMNSQALNKTNQLQIIKDFVQCLQEKGKIPSQMIVHFEKYTK